MEGNLGSLGETTDVGDNVNYTFEFIDIPREDGVFETMFKITILAWLDIKDTQDYDLVIEKDGKLAKVQVKATGCKTKNNIYQLSLKSCGGTKGKEYKTLINTNIDYLFILNADLKMYVIPKNEIKNKSTINLGEKMNKFIVEF